MVIFSFHVLLLLNMYSLSKLGIYAGVIKIIARNAYIFKYFYLQGLEIFKVYNVFYHLFFFLFGTSTRLSRKYFCLFQTYCTEMQSLFFNYQKLRMRLYP